jgi:hypothetical protein
VEVLTQCNGFGTAIHAQFAIDTADLGFNRIGGDDQGLGNFVVGVPGAEITQHTLFLWTQRSCLEQGFFGTWDTVFGCEGVQESTQYVANARPSIWGTTALSSVSMG